MKVPAIFAGATVALALAAPAGAHERPSVASVQSHADAATAALDRVEQLVAANDHASAAISLAKSRAQVGKATAETRRMTRSTGKGSAMRAAKANSVLAALNHGHVTVLTGLVEGAQAGQVGYARALAAGARGRSSAIETLTGLSGRLPSAAQSGIAAAIAALTAAGEAEVAQIAALSESSSIPAAAQPALERALGFTTEGINRAVDHLTQVLGLVPEHARPHLEMALGHITAALDRVNGILGAIGGSETGGIPVAPSLPIPQGLPIPALVPIG